MNIFQALSIGTASENKQLVIIKMMKIRPHCHLSDSSVAQLMRISIEGLKNVAMEF